MWHKARSPYWTTSSRMHYMSHNWSATKQHLHPQSVAEISRHSVLSGDRIRQCETSSGSRHKDTDQCLICVIVLVLENSDIRLVTTCVLAYILRYSVDILCTHQARVASRGITFSVCPFILPSFRLFVAAITKL